MCKLVHIDWILVRSSSFFFLYFLSGDNALALFFRHPLHANLIKEWQGLKMQGNQTMFVLYFHLFFVSSKKHINNNWRQTQVYGDKLTVELMIIRSDKAVGNANGSLKWHKDLRKTMIGKQSLDRSIRNLILNKKSNSWPPLSERKKSTFKVKNPKMPQNWVVVMVSTVESTQLVN